MLKLKPLLRRVIKVVRNEVDLEGVALAFLFVFVFFFTYMMAVFIVGTGGK